MTAYRLLFKAFAILCVMLAGSCATTRVAPPSTMPTLQQTMKTTGYCSCKRCCNWKRNWLFQPVIASGPSKGRKKHVGRTASGEQAGYGTIAADTKRYPFGTVMYVPGYGYGEVEDRGTGVKGDHIDLYFKKHGEAEKWGRRTVPVQVWLP